MDFSKLLDIWFWLNVNMLAVPTFMAVLVFKLFKGAIFKKKNIKIAKDKGHVIQGHLVSESRTGIDNTKSDVVATYQYSWEGKKYQMNTASSTYGAPGTLTLYFNEDPSCAASYQAYTGKDDNVIKIFLKIFLIWTFICLF